MRRTLLFAFSLCFICSAHAQNGYLVRAGVLTIRLSNDGKIVGMRIGPNGPEKELVAYSSIEGCSQRGKTIIHRKKDGSVECIRTLVKDLPSGNDPLRESCVVRERFIPTGTSIRWELEITGTGKPWSSAICTRMEYPATGQTGFWTTWGAPPLPGVSGEGGRPEGRAFAGGRVPPAGRGRSGEGTFAGEKGRSDGRMFSGEGVLMEDLRPVPGGSTDTGFIGKGNNQWTDPLHAIPFTDTVYYYGLPYFTYAHPGTSLCPFQGNLFCIPMCSILETKEDAGITLALSPGDDIIDMTLRTQRSGGVLFSRLFNRISRDHRLTCSMDIIAHEADWRCGLGWMTARYPDYFQPGNTHSYELAGTGAYSGTFDPGDTAMLRAMDFSTNWKASFDFPYMGMFLPPVKREETWKSFGGPIVSIDRMEAYAVQMKNAGFHVLSYFNVTEFGAKVRYPAPSDTTLSKADRWKDCNAVLYRDMPGAMLLSPVTDRPIYSWEGAVVMDCGDAAYRDFLLRQALRHIREIPDADGICIDRLDWLRWFNVHADDGRTWFYGKPARTLLHSFKMLMDTLGPMMHAADKSIFVNNHDKRIDILKNTDGIFDEFTYAGSPLNLTAFLCMDKSALGWTGTAATVKREGPDNFFQKYLYMGVFPMCPYPGNDHSIMPDTVVDRYYIDYAPLLRLLRGKKWVLKPHVIAIENDRAKVNLFETPAGYVIPVVYGKEGHVRVIINEAAVKLQDRGRTERGDIARRGGVPEAVVYAVWHPGENKPSILIPFKKGHLTYLDVPLSRGCAMVTVELRKNMAMEY